MDVADQWATLLRVPRDAAASEVCRAFERLAPTLAPVELTGWPVYCLPTSALPPEYTDASRHSGGWFDLFGYWYGRPHLAVDRGAGPVLIVHDIRTDEAAHRLARATQEHYRARGESVPLDELLADVASLPVGDIATLCGMLGHELAHAIDDIASGQFEVWNANDGGAGIQSTLAKISVSRFEQLVADKRLEAEAPPPQLYCHGPRFTRIVAHLDHRLRRVGVFGNYKAAGDYYSQRPYAECYAALGDEPSACIANSFAEILALPMPAAFRECAEQTIGK